MSRLDRDLLVVGAGPAGLATAIAAAQRGLAVSVVDHRAGVIDKACGEGLMPGAIDALRRLGVAIGPGHPFEGIRYTDGIRSVYGRFKGPPGLGVRRLALQEALVQRAEELGVERIRARVDGVEQGDWGVEAAGLRARWLVAADGLQSPIRRRLGLLQSPRRARRLGLRRHFAVAPRQAAVEVHWSPAAEAYVTPVGPDNVGVAFLFFQDRAPAARPGVSRYDQLLELFPDLQAWLSGAAPTSPVAGAGPFEQRVRRRVVGRVLLVGDAAGYLDPLTGEGLRLGFEAAEAATGAMVAGTPETYERSWRRITRRYWWMTAALLAIARSRLLRRALVPSLALAPPVMGAVMGLLAASHAPARPPLRRAPPKTLRDNA